MAVFCIKCGIELPDEAHFCWKCGAVAYAGTPREQTVPPTVQELESSETVTLRFPDGYSVGELEVRILVPFEKYTVDARGAVKVPSNAWWHGLKLNAEGARDLGFLDDVPPTALTALSVHGSAGTAFTDAGMVHLAGLVNLETLDLSKTAITDAGMVHLAGLVNLETLDLPETAITEAGMVHLGGLVNLETGTQQQTVVPPTKVRVRNRRQEDAAEVAQYRSKVKRGFTGRRKSLAGVFDAGHRFLRDLGDNRIPSFYIRTAKNAHLYYEDGYYCYMVLDKNEFKIRGRCFSHIRRGVTDNHELIFTTPMRGLIQGLDGYKDGWAKEIGEWIILSNATPAQFFDGLLELIRIVHKQPLA